jgi:hypothetical protein
MSQSTRMKVVSLKYPCTACLMIYQTVKESIDRILADYEGLEVEYIELENLKSIHQINGLEVEKFPALLINDEQITAGSVITKRQLVNMLKEVYQ